ncbi:MAG: O-antigen ligase family protein [Nitrospirae bacterium YQR-1]
MNEKVYYGVALTAYAFICAFSYLLSPYLLTCMIIIPAFLILSFLIPNFSIAMIFLTFFVQHTGIKIMVSSSDTMEYPLYLIFVFIALLVWIVNKAINKETQRVVTPFDIPLVIIFLLETMTLLWTPSLELGLYFYVKLIFNYITFYVITAFIKDEKSLKASVAILCVATFAQSVSVLVSKYYNTIEFINLFKGITLSLYGIQTIENRPMGLAGAAAAELMLMGILFIVSFSLRSKWYNHILYFACCLFIAYSIGVMAVRSAFLALIIGFVLLFYFQPEFRKRFFSYSIEFVLSVCLIVVLFTPGFIDRILIGFGYNEQLFFTKTSSSNKELLKSSKQGLSAFSFRVKMWKDGIKYYKQNPHKILAGIGISGLVYLSQYTTTEAHGLLLSFFWDMGILGIIALLYLFWKIVIVIADIYKLMNNTLTATIALVCAISVIIVLGIDNIIWADLNSAFSRFSWMIMALFAASYNVLKNNHASGKTS